VLKKVATSCGAVTAFFSAALGTHKVNCGSTLGSYARESALGYRAKIAGAAFLASFFAAKERRESNHTDMLKATDGLNYKPVTALKLNPILNCVSADC